LEKCENLVAECHRSAEPLKSSCSPSAFVKVSKQLGDLDSALDDVRLSVETSTAEQELETYYVDNYDNLLQVFNTSLIVALPIQGRFKECSNMLGQTGPHTLGPPPTRVCQIML